MRLYRRTQPGKGGLCTHPGCDRRVCAFHQGDRAGDRLTRSVGAKVTGMTVSIPFHVFALEMVSDTAEQYKKDCEDRAEKFLGAIAALAKAADVQCEVVHVTADHPYEGIIDTATVRGCDLILMASHGRKGVAGLILGSETRKVLTHGKIPVLVSR
ncbi:MAG TPA: universal stress protein [Gemmatimonadales bacterium]|nr:universal stress protein [Gemmatimonadales bacterium]